MSIRKAVVSGSFYPNDKDELEKLIKSFSNNINKNQDKKLIVKLLAKAVVQFSKDNLKYQIDAFMLKDFEDESLFITDALHKVGYYSFNVEPNMVFNLNENWSSFEDYLAAMKTKFRVKAKKALKVSADLIVEEVTLANIEDLLPKMTKLYKTVSKESFK